MPAFIDLFGSAFVLFLRGEGQRGCWKRVQHETPHGVLDFDTELVHGKGKECRGEGVGGEWQAHAWAEAVGAKWKGTCSFLPWTRNGGGVDSGLKSARSRVCA